MTPERRASEHEPRTFVWSEAERQAARRLAIGVDRPAWVAEQQAAAEKFWADLDAAAGVR